MGWASLPRAVLRSSRSILIIVSPGVCNEQRCCHSASLLTLCRHHGTHGHHVGEHGLSVGCQLHLVQWVIATHFSASAVNKWISAYGIVALHSRPSSLDFPVFHPALQRIPQNNCLLARMCQFQAWKCKFFKKNQLWYCFPAWSL